MVKSRKNGKHHLWMPRNKLMHYRDHKDYCVTVSEIGAFLELFLDLCHVYFLSMFCSNLKGVSDIRKKLKNFALEKKMLGTIHEGELTFCHSPVEFLAIFWVDRMTDRLTDVSRRS